MKLVSMDFEVDPELILDELPVSDILDYLGENDFLDDIPVENIVKYIGIEVLLDEISKDEALKYFGVSE